MNQYQVPQFIETKTKILGPFTFEQSVYIIGGAVLEYIIQYTLTGNFRLIMTVAVAGMAFLLAYGSAGGMSIPQFLLRGFIFLLSPRQYLYHKEDTTEQDIVNQITKSIPRKK